jgi:hypothetical protein
MAEIGVSSKTGASLSSVPCTTSLTRKTKARFSSNKQQQQENGKGRKQKQYKTKPMAEIGVSSKAAALLSSLLCTSPLPPKTKARLSSNKKRQQENRKGKKQKQHVTSPMAEIGVSSKRGASLSSFLYTSPLPRNTKAQLLSNKQQQHENGKGGKQKQYKTKPMAGIGVSPKVGASLTSLFCTSPLPRKTKARLSSNKQQQQENGKGRKKNQHKTSPMAEIGVSSQRGASFSQFFAIAERGKILSRGY